jgi:hypothetical protein
MHSTSSRPTVIRGRLIRTERGTAALGRPSRKCFSCSPTYRGNLGSGNGAGNQKRRLAQTRASFCWPFGPRKHRPNQGVHRATSTTPRRNVAQAGFGSTAGGLREGLNSCDPGTFKGNRSDRPQTGWKPILLCSVDGRAEVWWCGPWPRGRTFSLRVGNRMSMVFD